MADGLQAGRRWHGVVVPTKRHCLLTEYQDELHAANEGSELAGPPEPQNGIMVETH